MNDQLTRAQQIRKFLRDLFGSRLVEHLEAELFHQQSMYDARLLERDQEIAALRQEALRLQAKFDEFELDPSYFWWLAQRGRKPAPDPHDIHSLSEVSAPLSWREIQARHYAEQEKEASKETTHADPGRAAIVSE